MSRNLRALATKTSWPHSSKSRLTQGEWVPVSIAMRSEGSETKRRLRASGVVRSLPSSTTSPLCVSMRHRGRSTCRLCPIRLSPSVVLCYHPRWPILLPYWASEPVEDLQTQRVLRMGGRPSHLIFGEFTFSEADLLTNPAKHGCRHDERKSATPAGITRRGPGLIWASLRASELTLDSLISVIQTIGTTLLAPLVGLIGAVVGFYSGGQTAVQGAQTATQASTQASEAARSVARAATELAGQVTSGQQGTGQQQGAGQQDPGQ